MFQRQSTTRHNKIQSAFLLLGLFLLRVQRCEFTWEKKKILLVHRWTLKLYIKIVENDFMLCVWCLSVLHVLINADKQPVSSQTEHRWKYFNTNIIKHVNTYWSVLIPIRINKETFLETLLDSVCTWPSAGGRGGWGDGGQQDVLWGHATVYVTTQSAVEPSRLQEVNPASVNQTFTETTDLLTFSRRQKPAEDTAGSYIRAAGCHSNNNVKCSVYCHRISILSNNDSNQL